MEVFEFLDIGVDLGWNSGEGQALAVARRFSELALGGKADVRLLDSEVLVAHRPNWNWPISELFREKSARISTDLPYFRAPDSIRGQRPLEELAHQSQERADCSELGRLIRLHLGFPVLLNQRIQYLSHCGGAFSAASEHRRLLTMMILDKPMLKGSNGKTLSWLSLESCLFLAPRLDPELMHLGFHEEDIAAFSHAYDVFHRAEVRESVITSFAQVAKYFFRAVADVSDPTSCRWRYEPKIWSDYPKPPRIDGCLQAVIHPLAAHCLIETGNHLELEGNPIREL